MAFRPSGGAAKYTMTVDRFKGVDLAGNPTSKSPSRADWSVNMITDGNGYPQARHGYERVVAADERINGIYRLEVLAGTHTLVHHGTKISEWRNGELTLLYSDAADSKSTATQMENKLIILDGKAALVYANHGTELEPDWQVKLLSEVAYIPTTVISASPGYTPGGTPYDNVNLMSDWQYNQFLVTTHYDPYGSPDSGTADDRKRYRMNILQLSSAPVKDVIVEKYNTSTHAWKELTPEVGRYTVDKAKGQINFNVYNGSTNGSSYGLQVTGITGQDNYRVKFSASYYFSEPIEQKWGFKLSGTGLYPSCSSGYIYLTWPKNNAYSDTEQWEKSYDSNTQWGCQFRYFKIRLEYEKINMDELIKFVINDCDSGLSFDKTELIGEVSLDNLTDTFPKWGRGIFMGYGNDDRSTPYYLYARIYTTGTDRYLEVIPAYGELSYGGGSYMMYNGGTWYLYSGTIRMVKNTSAYPDRVNYCTIMQKYGYGGNADRLFVSGNPAMPNYDFWSDINDPTHFPDLNYARIGDENTAIMGYSWLSDGSLAVHKARSESDSSIYIRRGTVYNDQVTFSLVQGAIGLGVVSSRCGGYMNGDSLQLSEEGLFATVPVQNSAINERYAQNRGYFVNPLLKKQNLSMAEGIVHKGKYYLAVGDYVFVADGDQRSYSYKGDQTSYEWYVWDNVPVRVWWSDGNDLYFGAEDGVVYKFNSGYEDDGEPVAWEWRTPWMDFDRQLYYKKVKNVTVLSAPDLSQNYDVEYRYPIKPEQHKALTQKTEQEAPFLKGTNLKAKKISLLQLKISGTGSFGLSSLSILYTVNGRFKE